MTDIEYSEIINEWFAKLPNGFAFPPYSSFELTVLMEVLSKHKIQSGTFLPESTKSESSTEKNWRTDVNKFKEYVMSNYVYDGQSIDNMDNFFNAIIKHTKNSEILELIDHEKKMSLPLKSKTIKIPGIYKILYDLVNSTIKVSGGDPSELWFAIAYKGRVKGGVHVPDDEINGTADVVVGKSDTVSLKNYKNKTFDLGRLTPDLSKNFNKLISLLSILFDVDINVSITRDSLNGLLQKLQEDDTKKQFKQMYDLIKSTNSNSDLEIAPFKNLINKIDSVLKGKSIDNFVEAFCEDVDILIKSKIEKCKFWGFIVNKSEISINTTEEVLENLMCSEIDGKWNLPAGLQQFKSGNLFVLGTSFLKDLEQ